MADKFLSELEWKRFSKGRDLKEVPLAKALAALETAKGPEKQLEALDEIEKQAAVLAKGAKGDKELAAWLDGLDKSAGKQRKESEFELKKAARQESDDEEDDPVLLTSKMIPLLRQVKKGDEMQVLLARGGKEVAVLMSRKAISPSRRKLLTDYLKDGTPKFHKGVCIWEANAYTFVMETQAAGLAKKVKAALLKQVELRLKVRVRGEEEGDLDDDGEPAEENDGLEAEGEEGGGGKQVPEAPPIKAEAPKEAPKDDPEAAAKIQFEKKWPFAEKQVLELLRDGVGDVSKLRAVAEFVREKSEGGKYVSALAGITSLEKLIEAVRGAPPAPPTPPTPSTGQAKPEAKAPEVDAERAEFNKRLAALLPAIKTAVATGGEKGVDIKLKASEAGVFANKMDYERANALLDEAEALIKAISGKPEAKPEAEAPESETQGESQDSGAEAKFARRFAEVEPAYLELLAARNPEATKLRAVMGYANEQAEAGDHAKAIAALDRLDKMMEAARALPTGAGEPRAGIVAYRKSLLGLRSAVATVEGQIAALVKAIPGQLPDELDLAEDLAEELRESTEALQDLVDEAMNAAEDPAQPATKALRQQLDDYISELHSNEVVKHVDSNPFGVTVSVEKTLGAALESVRINMPALA